MSKLNVLLVDDNRHMLTVMRTALNGLGIQSIHEASDGATAFDELKRFPADVVFVDNLMMPIDGMTFTQMTRTAHDSPDPYVPIIMLTSHTAVRRVKEARDAGVSDFLAKPITVRAVLDRILAVIEDQRAFIRAPGYAGPDRRRRQDPRYAGPERRIGTTESITVKRAEILRERLARRDQSRWSLFS